MYYWALAISCFLGGMVSVWGIALDKVSEAQKQKEYHQRRADKYKRIARHFYNYTK